MNQIFAIIHGANKELYAVENDLESAEQLLQKEYPDEAFIVKSKTDLSKFDNKQLLNLYNKLTSKTTKKFASYNAGLNQVWKFLVPKDATPATKSVKSTIQSKEVEDMSFAKRANVTKEKAPAKKTPARKKTAAKKKAPTKKVSTKKSNSTGATDRDQLLKLLSAAKGCSVNTAADKLGVEVGKVRRLIDSIRTSGVTVERIDRGVYKAA